MSVLTNDTRYEDHINELKEGRTVTMCEVLDKAEARGEAKGIAIGENKGRITSIIDFVLDGTISLETGASKAKMTVEAFKSLMEEYKATGKVMLN